MKWLVGIFCFLFVLAVVIFQPERAVAAIVLAMIGGSYIRCLRG